MTGLGRAQRSEHGRPHTATLRGSSPNATDPSGFMVDPGYPAGLVFSGMNFAGLGMSAMIFMPGLDRFISAPVVLAIALLALRAPDADLLLRASGQLPTWTGQGSLSVDTPNTM